MILNILTACNDEYWYNLISGFSVLYEINDKYFI
jgi:hypothetical protein